MTDAFVTRLPFPGFYESDLSYGLDFAEENAIERCEERQGDIDADDYVADPALHIEAVRFGEMIRDHADWSKAHDLIAREYVEAFDTVFDTEIGLHLNLTFESMVSPREYNFTTDRVFAFLPRAAGLALHARAVEDQARLAKVLGDNFTSRDGFASFYSDDLGEFLAKAPDDLDHNEWAVLIEAVLFAKYPARKVSDDICEILQYSDTFGTAFEAAIDWAAFDAAVEDERDEMLAEIRVTDPYYQPAYRCPETPDMFRAVA